MALTYDPTGELLTNKISNEIHNVSSAQVVPLEGAFFAETLTVTGQLLNGGYVPLSRVHDYTFSPIWADRSYRTGKEVFSYILLVKPALYKTVAISYQATGGLLETELFTRIAGLPTFDTMDSSEWGRLVGTVETPIVVADDRPVQLDPISKVVNKLVEVYEAADYPRIHVSGSKDPVLADRILALETASGTLPNMTPPLASEAVTGISEIADEAELLAGVARDKYVTPLGLQTFIDQTKAYGIGELPTADHIVKPIITNPGNGADDYDPNNAITVKGYATTSLFYGTHTGTEWELAEDVFFTNQTDHQMDTTPTTTWTTVRLLPSTWYYLRVRFVSDDHVSAWSDTLSLHTAKDARVITKPTITFPVDKGVDIGQHPLIQAAPYVINNTDLHVITEWVISTGRDRADSVYTMSSDVDLESHMVNLALTEGKTYFASVRYGSTYGLWSEWSDPVEFTIKVVVLGSVTTMLGLGLSELLDTVLYNDDIITCGYVIDSTNTTYGYIRRQNRKGDVLMEFTSTIPNSRFTSMDILDDTIYVVGTGVSFTLLRQVFYLGQVDLTGTVVNEVFIDSPDNGVLTGVVIDNTGAVIACGSVPTGTVAGVGYVFKLTRYLELIYQTSITDTLPDRGIILYDITVDEDRIIYATGARIGASGDLYICKYDPELKRIGDTSLVSDLIDSTAVSITTDSWYLYITGNMGGAAYVAMFDKYMALIGDITFGNGDTINDITVLKDNTVVFAGTYGTAVGVRDSVLIQTDRYLNVLKTTAIGSNGISMAHNAVVVSDTSDVIAVGKIGVGTMLTGEVTLLERGIDLQAGPVLNDVNFIVTKPVITRSFPDLTETVLDLTYTQTILNTVTI